MCMCVHVFGDEGRGENDIFLFLLFILVCRESTLSVLRTLHCSCYFPEQMSARFWLLLYNQVTTKSVENPSYVQRVRTPY